MDNDHTYGASRWPEQDVPSSSDSSQDYGNSASTGSALEQSGYNSSQYYGSYGSFPYGSANGAPNGAANGAPDGSSYPGQSYGGYSNQGVYEAHGATPYPNQGGYGNQGGYQSQGAYQNPAGYQANPTYSAPKSRIVAGILGLFFGALGVHNFYAGRTTLGIIQLLVTLVSFPLCFIIIGFFTLTGVAIWAFIESIMYFIGSGSYAYDGHGVPMQA